MKVKFIEGNPNNGIAYDWKLIRKEYKKLGVPPEYDILSLLPLENEGIKWHLLNSERSVGKTTSLLLLGMVMNKLYGTVTQLVRHSAKEQKASYFEQLFATISAYNSGQYIEVSTNGKYNAISYYHKAFYYATNHEGKIERAPKPFCVALCSADCYTLCSTYEAPTGDLIVLDECFNETNTADEFVHFIHLHKTIVRERLSDKIFILGNNLDVNNIWYRMLTIHNDIRRLKKGDVKILKTCDGMPIFTAFLENQLPERRKKFNDLHYGFGNSELNSITGTGSWKMKQYPLKCMLPESETMIRGIYFSYHGDLYLECEFINTEIGIFLHVHPAAMKSALNGDILYVMHEPEKANQVYFYRDKLIDKIMSFYRNKKIVYSDNETGNLFEKFLKETLT